MSNGRGGGGGLHTSNPLAGYAMPDTVGHNCLLYQLPAVYECKNSAVTACGRRADSKWDVALWCYGDAVQKEERVHPHPLSSWGGTVLHRIADM